MIEGEDVSLMFVDSLNQHGFNLCKANKYKRAATCRRIPVVLRMQQEFGMIGLIKSYIVIFIENTSKCVGLSSYAFIYYYWF